MQIETKLTITLNNGYDETKFTAYNEDSVRMVYAMVIAAKPYNDKIKCIKMVRYALDIGLKEAKYFVEDAWLD